ncbi:MAG: ribulose-phosphate 3-epimerase [Terracidiphilus sp.]|jgi:ribulose-phosphate 3-epimerase
MNRAVKLEASLACANIKNLQADIEQLNAAGIDYLHIDIMDGKFVPNFALDFSIMRAARELSNIPQECHLMVVEPERYIDRTVAAGAEYVAIHVEATYHVQRALQQIRDAGAKSGIALNPATPLSNLEYILDDIDMVTVMTVNPGFVGQKLIPAMLRKIKDVRALLDSTGHDQVEIQVDGNVSFEHIPAMVEAGATMLVGGTSSVFHKDYSIQEAVTAVREILEGLDKAQ